MILILRDALLFLFVIYVDKEDYPEDEVDSAEEENNAELKTGGLGHSRHDFLHLFLEPHYYAEIED